VKIQRTLPPTAAALSAADIYNGLRGLLAGRRFIERLEEEVKSYFGVRNAFFVSSGKAALVIILKTLQGFAPNRDEVVIPAYTCFSVPSAIVKSRLRVTLCDINPENFDYDHEQLECVLNEKTLCVLVPHLFGIPSDTDKILKACRDRKIFVVEDGAQAMGTVTTKGRLICTMGDANFFSLGRGKPVTCGSGGIILTDSEPIAKRIREDYSRLPSPGFVDDIAGLLKSLAIYLLINPALYWIPAGLPFLGLGETLFYRDFPINKLSTMQAGLGLNWESRLDSSMKARSENVKRICQRLGRSNLCSEGNKAPPLLRFPVLLKKDTDKKAICELARKNGLGITSMYPSPINEIDEIKHQFTGMTYPMAKSVVEKLVTLPTHEFLTDRDIERIVRVLDVAEDPTALNENVNDPELN